jgi:hypothetical protein
MREWEDCRQIDLTSESPEWDPHDSMYGDQEDALLDKTGRLQDFMDRINRNQRFLSYFETKNSRFRASVISETSSQCQAVLNEIDSTLNEARFIKALKSNVRMKTPQESVKISVAYSSEQDKKVTAADLVKKWDIGLKAAEKTVQVTTQLGVKTTDNPRLNRRFLTNDHNMRYRRLGIDMYTDTLFASEKSKRGNKAAQVYGTSFGWSRAYGMKSKGEAHESYSILCSKVGVPDII